MWQSVKIGSICILAGLAGVAFAGQAKANKPPKPYRVSADLHEVVNLKRMRERADLDKRHEEMLTKQLFVCIQGGSYQLFDVYGENDYNSLPSFVTVDSALQLYHVFYDALLRTTEQTTLYTAVSKLTSGMLAQSVADYGAIADPQLKKAALKNVAYFGVAARILGLKASLPVAARPMVDKEVGLIRAAQGYQVGAIFPYEVDYSQFIARGHYTKTQKLGVYFRAMMWYGSVPLAVDLTPGREASYEQARQAVLMVRALSKPSLTSAWQCVYEPTTFFVGTADDPTPSEWMTLAQRSLGKPLANTAIANAAKFQRFIKSLAQLRSPRIQSRKLAANRGDAMPNPATQFRLMGQRYIADSEAMQRLTWSDPQKPRPFPTGLDVMCVLGSPRAGAIVDASPSQYNPYGWSGYLPERQKLVREFAALPPATWASNLYYGWLYALKALLNPAPANYPSFAHSTAWVDKNLNTALASWAELRHDTILYSKESGAEMGGADEDRVEVPGYVEPSVPLYERLIDLTQRTRHGLVSRNLMPKGLDEKFAKFLDLLSFLDKVSQKELKGVAVTKVEHGRIRLIEGEFGELNRTLLMEGTNFQYLSDDDENMALVADVHTGIDKALEEGVGLGDLIYVVVPVGGKLYLARGPVFSYYEFLAPISGRLTDHAWKAMVLGDTPPARPAWTSTFLIPGKPKTDSGN